MLGAAGLGDEARARQVGEVHHDPGGQGEEGAAAIGLLPQDGAQGQATGPQPDLRAQPGVQEQQEPGFDPDLARRRSRRDGPLRDVEAIANLEPPAQGVGSVHRLDLHELWPLLTHNDAAKGDNPGRGEAQGLRLPLISGRQGGG